MWIDVLNCFESCPLLFFGFLFFGGELSCKLAMVAVMFLI